MCGRVSVSKLCGDELCVRCVCVYVCVRAEVNCDGEGRKDKGGGEKDPEVKTVAWEKLCIRLYVCHKVTRLPRKSEDRCRQVRQKSRGAQRHT